ncbi:uncharacterized protein LOC129972646 [Argiope bruennichi]|uniref:uncharacterized protein LOC129972646 n=1 Tax=Argiope bruennichi TaxID=94029 RepID=UPI002493DE86|nr:uncharacterized protein LOC129972646 [Argiope bruennichi]
MAFSQPRLVIVIVLCFSIKAFLCSARRSKSGNEALLQCTLKQMCECGIRQRFEDCYNELTDNSKIWMVDELNTCNLVQLEYDEVQEDIDKICTLDREELRPCFNEFNNKATRRIIEASSGMHGPYESPAFERARKCSEAIVAFCQSTPDMCMSIG